MVGRSVLSLIAVGYAGFFAVTLMKPQTFSVLQDRWARSKTGETQPTFVATAPGMARLPETSSEAALTPTGNSIVESSAPEPTIESTTESTTEAATGPAIEVKPSPEIVTQLQDGQFPNGQKFRNERSNSVNDDLGLDILQAADETIAEESSMRKEMSVSVLKSMGISQRQYATIKMREKRLAQKLRAADERGSDGFKTLLRTDHSDWMKEYLGPIRYQRFMELAGNTMQ